MWHWGGTQGRGFAQLPAHPPPCPGPIPGTRESSAMDDSKYPAQVQGVGAGTQQSGERRGGFRPTKVFQAHWWHICQERVLGMQTHAQLAQAGPAGPGVSGSAQPTCRGRRSLGAHKPRPRLEPRPTPGQGTETPGGMPEQHCGPPQSRPLHRSMCQDLGDGGRECSGHWGPIRAQP